MNQDKKGVGLKNAINQSIIRIIATIIPTVIPVSRMVRLLFINQLSNRYVKIHSVSF